MAEPEITSAPRKVGSAPHREWTFAIGASGAALVLAAALLPAAAQPFRPLAFVLVLGLFLVCESVVMHVEFRRQTYGWSLAELALAVALVEVGGLWATLAWVVALSGLLVVQSYSPAKAVFNVAMAVLHGSVAVAVLQLFPAVPLTEPEAWFPLILAVLCANLVVALMLTGAIIGTAGYRDPSCGASSCCRSRWSRRSPSPSASSPC